MACGEAAASNASTRERHFPAMGRGTRDGPVGSAELSRRALLQPAAVAGAGGDSRRRRSSGRCAEFAGHRSSCSGFEPNYDPDGGLSDSDSLEDSSASTDDENVSRQKRLLEDALFGFFKKENKRLKAPSVGRDAFSVYSGKYFSEIIKRMPIGRKDVISKYGYECLRKYERTEVPSPFVRWLVGCVDTVSSQLIIVDEKIIELSKQSVHLVLGLPKSGVVAMPNKESGKNFILSRFNLAELPNITYFGNLLMSSEELSEEDTFICFMIVAMSCFLFPSSSDQIHTDFLSILEDPSATRGFDMCFLVYEWILSGINKYVMFGKETGRKPKVFDFCAYCLAVLYLDKLDFGVRVVDQGVPRTTAWKGNLIKHFSELDRKRSNLFGRRQFKKHDDSKAHVGARHSNTRSMDASLAFKDNLMSTFANVLLVQASGFIYLSFLHFFASPYMFLFFVFLFFGYSSSLTLLCFITNKYVFACGETPTKGANGRLYLLVRNVVSKLMQSPYSWYISLDLASDQKTLLTLFFASTSIE
ncbi:uncharacterized protein LOC123452915 isoform X3 [Hordeum vulgare subsp. vulgare]|uniref:uncharacterized protein LOC123452915 isoform X3 n=1 Tax=Hordeum vulgare subsp. vulgare TaxID=112509 RepID=UPI001D1A5089|nr:uncharacterized protein LOC123452915 isoform X3 [Hordeum vulgare subsp. vulgare]